MILSPHQFLLATPQQDEDELFQRAVIYLFGYDAEQGAVGFIINKPLGTKLGEVFKQLNFPCQCQKTQAQPVLLGGPIKPEHGYIIHANAKQTIPDISIGKDKLSAIAAGNCPAHYRLSLGYCGWSPGQLENEIANNAWLIAPYRKQAIFQSPKSLCWQETANSIGVTEATLYSGDGGYA